MTIQRCPHDKRHPYAIISKEVIFDIKLKPRARLLLITLLSLPDDWKLYPKEIAKRIGYNISTVYECLQELQAHGYCRVEKKKNERGHQATSEYYIAETPLYARKTLVGKNLVRKKSAILSKETSRTKKEEQQRAAPPKPPASVIVFSKKIEDKLQQYNVTQAERRRWRYSEAEVETALTVMESQESDNPLRTFRAALKRGWTVNPPKQKKGQLDPEKWAKMQNQTLKEKHRIVVQDNVLQFTGIETVGIKTYFKRKEINLNKTPLDEKLCEIIDCELTQVRQTY